MNLVQNDTSSFADLGQLLRWPTWLMLGRFLCGLFFFRFDLGFSAYRIVHVLHRQSHGVARALFGMSSPTLPSERYPMPIPLVHRRSSNYCRLLIAKIWFLKSGVVLYYNINSAPINHGNITKVLIGTSTIYCHGNIVILDVLLIALWDTR